MEPIACQNQNEKMHLHEKKDPTNNVHHNCNSNYPKNLLNEKYIRLQPEIRLSRIVLQN